jgi:hypothetical protein
MATTTFRPKNKSYYRGGTTGFLMARSGMPCQLLGTHTFPAEITQDRKPLTVAYIKFADCKLTFQVRPRDVDHQEA